MSYLLIVEGQEIPLSAEVAGTDETIRNCLAPYYPEALTATFKREDADGVTRICMVKSAGTKGSNVIQKLQQGEECLNPALALSWQLKQLERQNSIEIETLIELQPEINHAIAIGRNWELSVETSLDRLKQTQPSSSKLSIVGF